MERFFTRLALGATLIVSIIGIIVFVTGRENLPELLGNDPGKTIGAQTEPTATPRAPDTPPGSVLGDGDVWYQGGMEMRLTNPSFTPGCDGIFGVELTLENHTGELQVIDFHGLDISIKDDQGHSFPDIWWRDGGATDWCYASMLEDLTVYSMRTGDRVDVALRVVDSTGAAGAVSAVTVTIARAGFITDARWRFVKP